MTEQTQYPADPKAAAAAAKAYAKAQRPWYKKKRWIALMAFVAIIVIATISSSGGSGGGSGSTDTSSDQSAKKDSSAKTGANEENTIKQGAAFKLGDFEIQPGWKITKDQYVGYSVEGLKVKNTTGGSHNLFIDFRLYAGGKNQIADISCNTDTVNAGVTTSSVNCVPDGSADQAFQRITVANSM